MIGDLTAGAKILQLPRLRHDRRPADAGLTDTLDVMSGKLRDAAAAHDD
jgi:hypothetical protein